MTELRSALNKFSVQGAVKEANFNVVEGSNDNGAYKYVTGKLVIKAGETKEITVKASANELTKNLMDSPTGRAMLAMKNSTSAAQAFGISLLKYRLLAFVLSTIYAAIGGFLYMLFIRNASNSSDTLFALSTSLNILGAVIIGGTKSIWGTIGGTFIIYGIDKMFLQDIEFFRANPTLITLFCGILVIVVVMFFPGGLVQLLLEIKLKIKKLIVKIREGIYGKDIG